MIQIEKERIKKSTKYTTSSVILCTLVPIFLLLIRYCLGPEIFQTTVEVFFTARPYCINTIRIIEAIDEVLYPTDQI